MIAFCIVFIDAIFGLGCFWIHFRRQRCFKREYAARLAGTLTCIHMLVTGLVSMAFSVSTGFLYVGLCAPHVVNALTVWSSVAVLFLLVIAIVVLWWLPGAFAGLKGKGGLPWVSRGKVPEK